MSFSRNPVHEMRSAAVLDDKNLANAFAALEQIAPRMLSEDVFRIIKSVLIRALAEIEKLQGQIEDLEGSTSDTERLASLVECPSCFEIHRIDCKSKGEI